uniref:Neprilysin-1 n=1 Tax=Steinernema glaseri TaxID=37863 RepID=A0A1I7YGN2_9BILA
MRFAHPSQKKTFRKWPLGNESPPFGPLDLHRTRGSRPARKNRAPFRFSEPHSPTVSVISDSDMYPPPPGRYGMECRRPVDVRYVHRQKSRRVGLLAVVLFLAALVFVGTGVVLFLVLARGPLPYEQKFTEPPTRCATAQTEAAGDLPKPAPTVSSHTKDEACLDEECILLAATYVSNMKREVNPCDDFYEYACGNYAVSRYVPDHETKLNVISEMKFKLNKNLRDLLNRAERKKTGDAMQQMLSYYDSCMDDQAQDRGDLMPLNSLISTMGGWPLLQNAVFDDRDFSWEVLHGHLMSLGVPGVFSVFNQENLDNQSKNTLMIGNTKLLLGSKRHYLQPIERNEFARNYEFYMKELIAMLGGDEEVIGRSIKNVLHFDFTLANLTKLEENSNPSKAKHLLSFGDLKRKFQSINFELLLKTGLNEFSEHLTNSTIINVVDMVYLEELEKLLARTSLQTLNDYLMWKLVSTFDMYLPQRYRVPRENFKSVVYGVTLKPLWEECVAEVQKRMPLPLSVLFVQNTERTQRHQQIQHLLAALKVSVEELVMNSDWMDENTRLIALRKIGSIQYQMGSTSTTLPGNVLGNLNLLRDSFFDNAVQLRRLSVKSDFSALYNTSMPRSRSFSITPPVVDAFYDYFANQLVFTDAMLGYPLIGSSLPQSVNFGALGMAISHEMIHSIDDLGAFLVALLITVETLGSNYGENGLLEPWWSADMKYVYKQKKDCFVAQYGSKVEPETERYIDGKLTVNENIADNAGLRIAFNAFKMIENQNSTSAGYLPTFKNESSRQMFFLAFANVFLPFMTVSFD